MGERVRVTGAAGNARRYGMEGVKWVVRRARRIERIENSLVSRAELEATDYRILWDGGSGA